MNQSCRGDASFLAFALRDASPSTDRRAGFLGQTPFGPGIGSEVTDMTPFEWLSVLLASASLVAMIVQVIVSIKKK